MSAWISAAKEQAVLWWLTVCYFILFSFNSLSLAIVAVLYGVNWSTLSGQDKFCIVLICAGNWTNTMVAFFNKTISRVKSGEFPIAEGDTVTITRPGKTT